MNKSIWTIAVTGAVCFSLFSSANADVDVYAAKVVCHEALEGSNWVAPGYYRTVVNIYNPDYKEVRIIKKFSKGVQERRNWDPQVNSQEHFHTLGPMQTMAVDCKDIRLLYQPIHSKVFFDGMLAVMVPGFEPGIEPQPLVVKTVMTVEKRPVVGKDIQTHTVNNVRAVRIYDDLPQ